IKAALALKHNKIPEQLHFAEPNPAIPFDQLKLRVQTQLGDWPATSGPRYARVNSFGVGGTNAHVLLSEPPARPAVARRSDPRHRDRRHQGPPRHDAQRQELPHDDASSHDRRYLIPLSARSPEALTAAAGSLADFLSDNAVDLADVGHTCALR